jgi:hypothetical protein
VKSRLVIRFEVPGQNPGHRIIAMTVCRDGAPSLNGGSLTRFARMQHVVHALAAARIEGCSSAPLNPCNTPDLRTKRLPLRSNHLNDIPYMQTNRPP